MFLNSRLESNPVLFASFGGGVETVIVRVRNNEISVQGTMSSEKVFFLSLSSFRCFLF